MVMSARGGVTEEPPHGRNLNPVDLLLTVQDIDPEFFSILPLDQGKEDIIELEPAYLDQFEASNAAVSSEVKAQKLFFQSKRVVEKHLIGDLGDLVKKHMVFLHWVFADQPLDLDTDLPQFSVALKSIVEHDVQQVEDPIMSTLKLLVDEGAKILQHNLFTNAVLCAEIVFDMRPLRPVLLPLVPLLCQSLPHMGTKDMDFVQLNQLIGRKIGGISVYPSTSSAKGREEPSSHVIACGKAMAGRVNELFNLIQTILQNVQFTDQQHFKQFVSQSKERMESLLTGSGHDIVAARMDAKLNITGWHNWFETGYELNGSPYVKSKCIRNTQLWDHVHVSGGAYGGFCDFDSPGPRQQDLDKAMIGTIEDMLKYGTVDSKIWKCIALGNISKSTTRLSREQACQESSLTYKLHKGRCSMKDCIVEAGVLPNIVKILKDQNAEVASAALKVLETPLLKESMLEYGVKILHDYKAIEQLFRVIHLDPHSCSEKCVELLEVILRGFFLKLGMVAALKQELESWKASKGTTPEVHY
eukprot:Gb_30845 [translate_table: standard]